MTYEQTIDFLFTALPAFHRIGGAAYKANFDNTHTLDDHFGHPHRKFLTVHVAGTNGKGSVSHSIASVLAEAGYKTGLYTSPHLKDFRERIRVNGEMISQENVVSFVDENREIIERIKPSFFEMTVAMAFDHFANEQVDVAVVEVGMGGRLDSTNIITPLVSVITNISLDHTQFLGDTKSLIAVEKAGIIKEGVPVVVGESDPETDVVFLSKGPVLFADKMYCCTGAESKAEFQTLHLKSFLDGYEFDIDVDLFGDYQRKNIVTVIAALDVLRGRLNIPRDAVERGLRSAARNTGLAGRWQVLSQRPYTVCDTGHNKGGIAEIAAQLSRCKYRKLFMVIGFVADKDLDQILPLLPRDAYYIFTQPSSERALPADKLAEKAVEFHGKVVRNVSDAIVEARRLATDDDMIYIGGSTFVVADI